MPQLTDEKIAHSVAQFQGAWRRFDYKGKTERGVDVYDDYAHHPTAVKETLRALKEKTKGKVIVAFHPHLYSRTRDLLDGFARSFEAADKIYIAPIYAAREVDDGTVSSELLASRIRDEGGNAEAVNSLEQLETLLRAEGESGDVIMTMGAGDVFKVADAIVSSV
jgi:UDP-N-acetylmuramate--alanine ligase